MPTTTKPKSVGQIRESRRQSAREKLDALLLDIAAPIAESLGNTTLRVLCRKEVFYATCLSHAATAAAARGEDLIGPLDILGIDEAQLNKELAASIAIGVMREALTAEKRAGLAKTAASASEKVQRFNATDGIIEKKQIALRQEAGEINDADSLAQTNLQHFQQAETALQALKVKYPALAPADTT